MRRFITAILACFPSILLVGVLVMGLASCAKPRPGTPRITSFAGPFSTNRATVIFEVRYYVSRPPGTVGAFPKHLSMLQNSGTNFKCSVEAPYRLSQGTNGLSPFDVTGFVMQIVEPPKYAGQVLTARYDGYGSSGDPFAGLAVGTRYQATIDVAAIGYLPGGLLY